MHPNLILFPAIVLWLSSAVIAPAQETVQEPPLAEASQDLFDQVLGYWVVDLEAAKTKDFIATVSEGEEEAIAEIQKEMTAATFEFKPDQMMIHEDGDAEAVKITVKSQELEQRILVADFQSENDDPVATTLHINGDRITLSAQDPQGRNLSFGLKRIDEETFKRRVSEEEALQDQDAQAIESEDDYPVATWVPDRPGFVISPHSQKVVDVRNIPSGTIVADPRFPPSEKKFFRVP